MKSLRAGIGGRDVEAGRRLVKNISCVSACKQLMEETIARFGKLDGLVNNAGTFPRGTLLDTTEDLYQTVFDVNFKASFFCA